MKKIIKITVLGLFTFAVITCSADTLDFSSYINIIDFNSSTGTPIPDMAGGVALNEADNLYYMPINKLNKFYLGKIDLNTSQFNFSERILDRLSLFEYSNTKQKLYAFNLDKNELVSVNDRGEQETILKISDFRSLNTAFNNATINENDNEYIFSAIDINNNNVLYRVDLDSALLISKIIIQPIEQIEYNNKLDEFYGQYKGKMVSININTGALTNIDVGEVPNLVDIGNSTGSRTPYFEPATINSNKNEYIVSLNYNGFKSLAVINTKTNSFVSYEVENEIRYLKYNNVTNELIGLVNTGLTNYKLVSIKLPQDTTITGINEQTTNAKISIYPNPSTGSFSLQLQQPLQNASLQITNSVGVVVYSQSYSNLQNTTINTTEFSRGLYNVSINTGNISFSKKLVVY